MADGVKGHEGGISQGGYRKQHSRSVNQDGRLGVGAGQSGALFVQSGPSTQFNAPTRRGVDNLLLPNLGEAHVRHALSADTEEFKYVSKYRRLPKAGVFESPVSTSPLSSVP
jgi:hypothetical protein